MSAASDYQELVDQFVESMSALGGDLCSIILYGSIVKGRVRHGYSDLLDAVALFPMNVLDSEAAFSRVMDVVVQSCRKLAGSGVPFHPFHYYMLGPSGWSAVALYLPTWTSDRYSRIVAGEDLRPLLRTSDGNREFMRGWYFTLSRKLQRQAVLLMDNMQGNEERRQVLPLLREFTRNLPQFACFACNRAVDRSDAVTEIAGLFPGIDIRMLQELSDVAETASLELEPEKAGLLLTQALEWSDTLSRAVAEWLRHQNSAVQPVGDIPASPRRDE